MAQFDIFIDTNSQTVVRGFTDSTTVPLPAFVQGDTPTLRIWPLVRTVNFLGPTPYAFLGTAGLTLQVAIGDRIGNTTVYYTQQFTWVADALAQSFSAQLPLNTAAITTLLGATSQASTWFEVKYLSGGLPTTVLDASINVQAAVIKVGAVTIPAGATAISAEEVNASCLKRTISGVVILKNDNTGKQVAMYLSDDGTVHFDPIS
jgi:hypothetical protein